MPSVVPSTAKLSYTTPQGTAGQHPNDTPLAQSLVRLFAGLSLQESLDAHNRWRSVYAGHGWPE